MKKARQRDWERKAQLRGKPGAWGVTERPSEEESQENGVCPKIEMSVSRREEW